MGKLILAFYIYANRQRAAGLLKERGPGDKRLRAHKKVTHASAKRLKKAPATPVPFLIK
ncbi:hypothetical protein [Rhodoferax sp. UBA5149]|uniref:hypothetical protein n=1 Tax=Rhodoferax sp. UBA5149 TaxID=1947379 RepID=UPI0025FD70BB|nr:hypothetical protein [Rhodoferax sp. UBA5149]